MQRRSIPWLVALTIVVGGGILPAVFILRAPKEENSPGGVAPLATSTSTRPRLTGIASSDEKPKQAPLRFADAQPPVRNTLPIPSTVDDPRSGVHRASTDAIGGPSLGAPRGDAADPRPALQAVPPAPLNAAPAYALPQPLPTAPAPIARGEYAGGDAPSLPLFGSVEPPLSAVRQEPPEPIDEPIGPPIERTTAMRRAARHNQEGLALTAKGAWYSARAEFQSALELVIAATDSLEGSSARSRALREAHTALREAGDFAPRSGRRTGRVDVAHLVAGHQSQVIDEQTSATWTAAAAHEAYLAYAKRRLADAGAGQRAASVSLHGLGKVHAALGAGDQDHAPDSRKKARTYYEAGLEVGPDNFIAANDLAVLLAEEGDLERGRATLEAGLRVSRQPAMLENLAGIYRRLGQPQVADQLRSEAAVLERYATAGVGDLLPSHHVHWLDPQRFAATARGGADAGRTPSTTMPQVAANPALATPVPGTQPFAAGPQPGARVPITAARSARNGLVY